jgi:cytochrome c biogenesis protein CcmG/thiol:disulfide interchange protein DsbE
VIRDKLVGILTPENFASVLTRIRAAGNVAAAQ